MTLPSRRSSLIRALTILSPVVFQEELSRELRSSSPSGLGCMENMTSDMASFAERVSTGTVRWGLPSEVNSTIPAIPTDSGVGVGLAESCGATMKLPVGPRDFSRSSNRSLT